VQGEVKAAEGDLLRVYDHFKPGVPEFAALLPPRWAVRLQRWDRARVARPVALGAAAEDRHAQRGRHAGLRLLAACRRIRPLGSRYATEQALIQQWLDAVVQGLRTHAALGHEIALCGRLIKGYGSTNERGKDNLLHVLQHLAVSPTLPDPADAPGPLPRPAPPRCRTRPAPSSTPPCAPTAPRRARCASNPSAGCASRAPQVRNEPFPRHLSRLTRPPFRTHRASPATAQAPQTRFFHPTPPRRHPCQPNMKEISHFPASNGHDQLRYW
jgi:hypothetical protein